MISFLILTLGFVCSFCSCFKCKFRWFTWDFTYFLRWECISINFHLRTAFVASQTLTWPDFCMCYFLSKSTAAKARLVSVVGHLLSIQIFHRCRVYQTYFRALVWGLCSYLEEISFLFLVAQPLRLSFGFGPSSACKPPSGICSTPMQRGAKAKGLTKTDLPRPTRAVQPRQWVCELPVVVEIGRQLSNRMCHAYSGGSPSRCLWMWGQWHPRLLPSTSSATQQWCLIS